MFKQLQVRHSHICDDLHNPETNAPVFAEDAIWESEDFGRAKGHVEIRAIFQKFRDMFTFSQHNMTNPNIEANGDRAMGIWYISGPWTQSENNHAIWMMARYDDGYVRIDGEWKYQHLRAAVRKLAE